jgi:hypothetical protein
MSTTRSFFEVGTRMKLGLLMSTNVAVFREMFTYSNDSNAVM